jgi:hypothetical protein
MVVKFEGEWYTPKEVGAILKVSPVTVARIFHGRQGVIDVATEHSPTTHNRQHLRISAEALQRWLNERGTLN